MKKARSAKGALQLLDNVWNSAKGKAESVSLKKVIDLVKLKGGKVAKDEIKHLAERIEEAINEEQLIHLELSNNQSKDFFPHRLLYIENDLSLIAEKTESNILEPIALWQIQAIKSAKDKSIYRPTYGQVQLDDYVFELMNMSDKAERIVIKFFAPENLDLSLKYHYMKNPFVGTNPNGDFIWGATLFTNPDLFEWLYSLNAKLEVLAPDKFKSDYFKFCLDKLEKEHIALMKRV